MMRWIEIDDRSAVAEVRRRGRRHAAELGLSDARIDEVAIVITEAATNILKYAGHGRILLDSIRTPWLDKMVLVFTDRGPGIAKLDQMMQDGASTSGSAGVGLGAIMRLSDVFDIYSTPTDGTTIVCTFEARRSEGCEPALDIDGLCVCHPSETVCGDAWVLRYLPPSVDVLLCDGLGHGAKAAEAAEEVLKLVRASVKSAGDMIAYVTEELVGRRGAVAAMVRFNPEERKLDYSGIGNISTLTASADSIKRFPVRDGRIGGPPARGYEESRDIGLDEIVILHSDGLVTLREGVLTPALLSRSTLLIAAFLLDRMFRGRDDASIVVARLKEDQRS